VPREVVLFVLGLVAAAERQARRTRPA